MTEHALIMCREPGRHSTLDKGHEEGGSAYANALQPTRVLHPWDFPGNNSLMVHLFYLLGCYLVLIL